MESCLLKLALLTFSEKTATEKALVESLLGASGSSMGFTQRPLLVWAREAAGMVVFDINVEIFLRW